MDSSEAEAQALAGWQRLAGSQAAVVCIANRRLLFIFAFRHTQRKEYIIFRYKYIIFRQKIEVSKKVSA